MTLMHTPVYLATVLLERNRWNGKGPSLLVSDWLEPAGEAGFAGLEVWMNHLLLASRSEWELIRQKSRDLGLSLAILNAYVPTDGSDKARRLRDAVTEACHYFEPDGMKINIGEKSFAKATDEEFRQALEFVKDWGANLPRNLTLLMENHAGTYCDDPGAATRARDYLGPERFKLILHPFTQSPEELRAAFDRWGDGIVHMHVQTLKGDKRALLSENRELVSKCIAVIKEKKYTGTWSLEFTKGTGQPGEDVDDMFDNAEKDLNFLHAALARGAGPAR